MNKFLLLPKLPKFIAKPYSYVDFSKIQEDEFFLMMEKKIKVPRNLYSKNASLRSNSNVLKYVVKHDISAISEFDSVAFSDDVLEEIVNSKFIPSQSCIYKLPILVSNEAIKNKVIKKLEESNYIVNEKDISLIPDILNSDILMNRVFNKKHNFILKLRSIDERLVEMALSCHFVPKKEHFYSNPELLNFESLLRKALQYDSSIIDLFKPEFLNEDDLKKYPHLCDDANKMNIVVSKNPRLIIYAKCCLYDYIVEDALKHYEITENDLKAHPYLCENTCLMDFLPQFNLYRNDLFYDEKKKAIIDSLSGSITKRINELPFLNHKFGAQIDSDKLLVFINVLMPNDDLDDIDVQQEYFNILDGIINKIIDMRYIEQKKYFAYPDIVSIDEEILNVFYNAKDDNIFNEIDKLVMKLHNFIGGGLTITYLKNNILNIYKLYVKYGSVGLYYTTDFYNDILNQHRNYFVSREKNNIKLELSKKLELTQKKQKSILNSKKLLQVDELLKNKNYDKLGITEEQINSQLFHIKEEILSNKDIIKKGIIITDEIFEMLENSFLNGISIIPEAICGILKIDDLELAKYMLNKYQKLKISLTNRLELDESQGFISDYDKSKFGYNYNNFIIASKNKCYENIADLILIMDKNLLRKILCNKNIIKEVSFLLPLTGIFPELRLNTLINILLNYPKVKEKLLNTYEQNCDTRDFIISRFDEFIMLANIYSDIDDISLCVLGRDVVDYLDEKNINTYLEFYLKMLSRTSSSIPQVKIDTSNLKLDSGDYSNPERLLIGKKNNNSCIDLLGISGKETYEELLIGFTGDVIIVRNNRGEYVSRIMMFRRGNIIQLVTQAGQYYPISLYEKIASQILEKSIAVNDNIDYVFVNGSSVDTSDIVPIVIHNLGFKVYFPHADFADSAILINSKKMYQGLSENIADIEENIDFDASIKNFYLKERKKISYNPSEVEITRLRALRIILEQNKKLKEIMKKNFEPFYMDDYLKVICGEDWYIAIKKDGSLEELILPKDNMQDVAMFELNKVKSDITEMSDDYPYIKRMS